MSGGKHIGNCVCGIGLAEVNCNVVDGKCDTCGRIVGGTVLTFDPISKSYVDSTRGGESITIEKIGEATFEFNKESGSYGA